MKPKTICLNMIVKNESHVIARCLDSVLPIIDSWVICDTGSSDGTQKIIEDYFASKNIPGKLYQDEWVDFSTNRNLAYQRAEGIADYILVIDADDFLVYSDTFNKTSFKQSLDKDCYSIKMRLGDIEYVAPKLIINHHTSWFVDGVPPISFSWNGRLHEHLVINTISSPGDLYTCRYGEIHDPYMQCQHEGDRSNSPVKYLKDAELLQKDLFENPDDPRTLYYLGQSYSDAGEIDFAIEYYLKRTQVEGWNQERYQACLNVSGLLERKAQGDDLSKEIDMAIDILILAFNLIPSAPDAPYHLARIYSQLGYWNSCEIHAAVAYKNRFNQSGLVFNDPSISWRCSDIYALASYKNGHPNRAFNISRDMFKQLKQDTISAEEYNRLVDNHRYYRAGSRTLIGAS